MFGGLGAADSDAGSMKMVESFFLPAGFAPGLPKVSTASLEVRKRQ